MTEPKGLQKRHNRGGEAILTSTQRKRGNVGNAEDLGRFMLGTGKSNTDFSLYYKQEPELLERCGQTMGYRKRVAKMIIRDGGSQRTTETENEVPPPRERSKRRRGREKRDG
ncbi:hypothetical protein RJT34_22828 [Clitoria ternatea]|uniref:Uncharacterized protein n=1 Tax=Clitoria ternatea TaxID=43366 RepID=A0AAN9IKY4_CLITE